MIKAVIFDMDGTIVDSWNENINNRLIYLNHLGVQLSNQEIDGLDKISWRDTASYINEVKGTNYCSKAIYDGIQETHYDAYRNVYELVPGFLEFIDFLDKNKIKYVLATATRLHGAQNLLSRFNLLERFQFILTEGRVGYTKKFPNIYLEAANRLNLSASEILVFEDALYALKTAKEAGFKTVALKEKVFIHDWDAMSDFSDYMIEDYYQVWDFIEDII